MPYLHGTLRNSVHLRSPPTTWQGCAKHQKHARQGRDFQLKRVTTGGNNVVWPFKTTEITLAGTASTRDTHRSQSNCLNSALKLHALHISTAPRISMSTYSFMADTGCREHHNYQLSCTSSAFIIPLSRPRLVVHDQHGHPYELFKAFFLS